MLHITNGDSVLCGFRQAQLPGTYLAWRDPLHDGPVPVADSLPRLSEIRARALAKFGWGGYQELLADFRARDATLNEFREHEEVVLWFEHDLYDRLQLLQILEWFSDKDLGGTRLSLIEIDSHAEVSPFYGLGQLNGGQLAKLLPGRVDVTPDRLGDAARRWKVFTSDSHERLTGLDRLLEEYPGVGDGLSRTQRQLLLAAQNGPATREELYRGASAHEECPWGDSSVYLRLDDLVSGPDPALLVNDRKYSLTETGEALLAGQKDWIQARGGADLWLGGVHLTGSSPKWRWDSRACRLQPQTQ